VVKFKYLYSISLKYIDYHKQVLNIEFVSVLKILPQIFINKRVFSLIKYIDTIRFDSILSTIN